jgi:collagen type III alpha
MASMSTVNEANPAPVLKYETFVEQQLARARHRIRALDLAAASLGFLIITLAYGLATAVLDRLLALPPVVRQVAFLVYVFGCLAYIGVTVIVPLCRQINPYFAALQVEHSLPGAKNSVINWLDLRRQQLPVAIQGAVIHRAARELARADLDQAISAKRAGWLGGALSGLVLALLVLFLLGPRQFYSLMGRAFAPFNAAPMATRTFIRVIQPAEGDAVVPVGRAVTITAQVDGNVPVTTGPHAIRLLLRYQPGDPYEERLLRRGEESGEWTILVSAPDVHNGFWYKVAGGDAETPEYHIQVRSTPLLTDFSATYQFRPYVNRADQTTRDPNLEALRGTKVTLVARTNRDVASGSLVMDGETPIAAALVSTDPQALSFEFTIEKDTTYRIWFTSADNEKNSEPAPYSIRALPDQVPHVELTKPGKDISLPANGLLRLTGVAQDDFGLTRLTLKIRVDSVQSKPYRKGKSFQLAGGGYPRKLDYTDFVELDNFLQKDGQHLLPGMTIEYWLEAVDNCDYPSANVGTSEHFKVKITDPANDPGKRQKDREQAAREQQAADQNQDQELRDSDQGSNPQKENGEQSQKESGEQAKNDEAKLEDQADKLRRAIGDQGKSDKADASDSGAGDQQPDKQKGQGGGDQRDPPQNQNADGNSSQKKDQPKDDKGQNEQQKNSSEKGGDESGDRQPDGSAAQKPSNNGTQSGDRHDKKGDQKDNPSKGDKGNERSSGQGDQRGDQPKGDQANGQKGDNGNQSGNQSKGDKTTGQTKGANGDQQGTGAEKAGEPKRDKTGDQQGDDKDKQGRDQAKGRKSDAQSKENKGSQQGPGDGTAKNGEPQRDKVGGQQGDKGKQERNQSEGDKGDTQSKGNKSGEQGPGEAAKKNGEPQSNKTDDQQGDKGKQERSQSKGEKTDPQSKSNEGGEKGPGDGAKKNGEPQRGKPAGQQGDSGKQERSQSRGDKSDAQSKESKSGDRGRGDGTKKIGEHQSNEAGDQKGDKGKQGQGESRGDKSDAQSKEDKGSERGPGDGAKKNGEPQRDEAGGQQGDKSKQEQGKSKGDKSDAQSKENKDGKRGAGGADDKNSQPKAGGNSDQKGDGKKDSPDADKAGERAKADGKEQRASKSGAADPREDEKKTTNKGQGAADRHKAEKQVGEKGQGGGDEKESGKPNVEELIKALKNGDATARRDAARRLSDIKDQIDDPRLRQAAEEALRQSGEGADRSKSGKRAENQAQDSGENPDKRPESEKPTKTKKDANADGKGEKTDAGQKAGRGDRRGDGDGTGEHTPQTRRDGRSPPPGDNGRRQDTTAVNSDEPPEHGQAANAKYQKRAGALQLEDLKKKVNKDVLKKANMTPEEYQQFLKAYQEMLKRKESEVGNEEKLTDPKAGSRGLGSMKSRAGAAPKGKTDDLQHGDTSLPPPEFREGYPEFTRKLSELERTREGQKPGSK